MLIVTHEMEFERDVAPRMVFIDKEIIEEEGEEGTPEQVFAIRERNVLGNS